MKFISDKGLDELKRYQYKSGGYTTIDNLMNDFWFGISERLPLVNFNFNIIKVASS